MTNTKNYLRQIKTGLLRCRDHLHHQRHQMAQIQHSGRSSNRSTEMVSPAPDFLGYLAHSIYRKWTTQRKRAARSPRERRLVLLRSPNSQNDDPHVRYRPLRHNRFRGILRAVGILSCMAITLRSIRRRQKWKHQFRRIHKCAGSIRIQAQSSVR